MIDLSNHRPFRPALAGAVALLLAGGCEDDVQGPPVDDGPSTELLPALIVSNPVTFGSAAGAGARSAGFSVSAGAVYASLPPGTFPDGDRAVIRTRGTGAETTVLMVDGGFDPISIAAATGDTIDIEIERTGAGPLGYYSVVPPVRSPVIVRTDPPPQKRDVPLNAVMLVVFSEPIDGATLTATSAQLLLGGEPVAGTLGFADTEHLAVTFTPAESLAPDSEYTLVISRAIEDLDGDALAEEARVDFTTVTAAATRVFTQVSAGGHHTCGVTNDQVLYCWGSNFYGQLGTGSTRKNWLATPVRWDGLGFGQVSTANGRTCGVATDGVAYCWGYNQDGQLGDGTLDDRLVPTPVAGNVTFAQVSAGHELVGGPVAGVATDGVAYCWPACWGLVTNQPAASASGLTFAQVSAGGEHVCGVTTDGAAYCWGLNFDGQFGDGTTDEVGPRPGETPVAGGLEFAQVSAGSRHTCGVSMDNIAYCWGLNVGRLGDGTTDRRLVPTPVAGSLSFAQLSTGQHHTCGVTTDNLAYCWGLNYKGELGDGTTEDRLVPTPVAGGLSFAQVSAGDDHTCAITTDAVVYCWGFNHSGQLGSRFGYDTNGNRLTPTPIEPVF